jgi:glucose/arabinose dehydrogenase
MIRCKKLSRCGVGVAAAAVLIAGCGRQATLSPAPAPSATPARSTQTTENSVSARGTTTLNGHTLSVPQGWHAEQWASVSDARLETWTPQGALLVSEPDNGTIAELTPVRGQPGATPRVTTIVSGLSEPQGMAFDRVNGRELLFVAEDDQIDCYVWDGDRVGTHSVIVKHLPDTAPEGSDNHTLKNIVVGSDGRLYVDIGSGSNASPIAAGQPPRASVVSYTTSGTERRVFATGVRNGDGLSVAPDGSLWTAVNARDQIAYPYHKAYDGETDADGQVIGSYVSNHPTDQVAKLTSGRNLGWPYCNADPDVTPGSATTAFTYTNLPFIDDEQNNADGSKLDCAKLPRLQVGLPAHSAPLGFHFLHNSRLPTIWRSGAVLAVHGSWDARPPRAPAVLWMPWNPRTRTLGRAITLIGGFQNADGQRWGRTVDAVPGPDGALYVTDDQSGAVYRFTS